MSHPETFVNRMNEQSEDALSSLLGQNIGITFPDAWIDINREGISTSSVSIFLYDKQSYVIIDSERAETPYGLDYSLLNAFPADKPNDIEDPESDMKPYNVCTLLTWTSTVIQRIVIYEHSVSIEKELLIYDSAILFEYDGGRILFSRHEGWPDRLEINYKLDGINGISENMRIRKGFN